MILLRPFPASHRSRRFSLRASILAAVAVAACATPTAALASGAAVVADCAQDSKLDKSYSAADYKDALAHIPTDVDEYTNCRDVIRRAQLNAAGGTTSGGSSGGSSGGAGGAPTGGGGGSPGAGTPGTTGLNSFDTALAGASAQERAAVDKAVKTAAPVLVGGRALRTDSLGHGDLGNLNSLPTPFVIVLILLALGAVAALVPPVRNVVRSRRHGPLA